jgi:hypothetical protein
MILWNTLDQEGLKRSKGGSYSSWQHTAQVPDIWFNTPGNSGAEVWISFLFSSPFLFSSQVVRVDWKAFSTILVFLKKLCSFATAFLSIKGAQWSLLSNISRRHMALPSSIPTSPVLKSAIRSVRITFPWRYVSIEIFNTVLFCCQPLALKPANLLFLTCV